MEKDRVRVFSISKTRLYFSFFGPPSVPLELGVKVAGASSTVPAAGRLKMASLTSLPLSAFRTCS